MAAPAGPTANTAPAPRAASQSEAHDWSFAQFLTSPPDTVGTVTHTVQAAAPRTTDSPSLPTAARAAPHAGSAGRDPLWVLDANKAVVITPGVTQHDFSTWAVDLRAQVSGATVSTYSWNLSGAPDATGVTGSGTYRLQFSWRSFTGAARTETITLTTTNTDNTQQTQTLTFLVAGTDSPAYAAGAPTSASTWPSVVTPDQVKADQATVSAGPYAALGLLTGEVDTAHALPAYNPGVAPLSLIYNSAAANAQPVFLDRYTLDPTKSVPSSLSAQLTLNGVAGSTVYFSTAGLNPGDVVQLALQGSATALATGRYSYSLGVTANYPTPVTTTTSGSVNIVNESGSPFGAGWTLSGYSRLYPLASGALLELPGGTSLWFANGATSGTYVSPAGDFSTLMKNGDGTYTRTLPDGTKYNFDSTGRQTSVVDRVGNTTNYGYDGSGRLVSITDMNGLATTLSYNAAGKVSGFTDPANRTTALAYDAGNVNLTGITDPDTRAWAYAYDTTSRLTTLTDPLLYTTTFAYGLGGRVQTVTRADNTTEGLTALQVAGLPAAGTGSQANPATPVLAAQAQASYTDPRNNVWTTRLDWLGFGRPAQQVDPLNDSAVAYRDANGLAWLESDPLGHRTRSFFDSKGNPTQVVRPDDSSTQNTFNSFAEPTQVTQVPPPSAGTQGPVLGDGLSSNPTWTYSYDTVGNMLSATDPNNQTTSYTYNSKGAVLTRTDALNHTTSYAYDTRNRVTSVTDPLNHTVTFGYDAASDQTTVTDALNRTTTRTFDPMGRVLTVTDPRNGLTSTGYDADGQVVSLTDPDNNVTRYTRDPLERVTQMADPLNHSEVYAYDAAGNLTSGTDRDGRQVVYAYDAANRRTSERWLDGTGATIRTITIGYDAAGEVTSEGDPSASYSFAYDTRGRLTTEDNQGTPGVPHVVLTYGYDAFDNLTSVQDNLGGTVSYAYDPGNRLTSGSLTVSGVQGPQVALGYDAADRLTSLTRSVTAGGATVSTAYGYDNADRTTSISHSSSQAGALNSFSYGYDAASQLTGYTGPEGTLSYTYDAGGELTGVSGARSETFSYDPNGNRTMAGYSTGSGNRLASDGAYNYTYDNEGNVLTRTRVSDGQVTSYTWDYRNRLTDVQVKSAGGVLLHEEQYTYDALDRRIGVLSDGVQTWTVYRGDNAWADFSGSGALAMRYLSGLGADQLWARRDGSGNVGWYLTDLLGSVRQVVSTAGGVLYAASYSAFGQLLSGSGTGGDRFGFTGRESSGVTGDYYYRARYYSPGAGRFLGEDPLGFDAGDANLYRYVRNSPTNATDPGGLQINPVQSIPTSSGTWERIADEKVRNPRSTLREDVVGAGGALAICAGVYYGPALLGAARVWLLRRELVMLEARLARIDAELRATGGQTFLRGVLLEERVRTIDRIRLIRNLLQ